MSTPCGQEPASASFPDAFSVPTAAAGALQVLDTHLSSVLMSHENHHIPLFSAQHLSPAVNATFKGFSMTSMRARATEQCSVSIKYPM